MLATYETQLAQEDTVPESSQALDSRRQELAVSVQTLGPGSPSLSWAWALRAPVHPPPLDNRGSQGPGQQVSPGLESQPHKGFVRPAEIRCWYLQIRYQRSHPLSLSLKEQTWPPVPRRPLGRSAEQRQLCLSPGTSRLHGATGPL